MNPRRSPSLRAGLALLATLAAVLASGLAASPPAGAARHMEVALQDDAVLLHHLYYDPAVAMSQIRALGVTSVRSNVLWANTMPGWQANARREPATVDYNWSDYDRLIDAATANGIRVQLTVAGPAPAWAAGNRRVGPFRPDAAAYGRFVRAVALHFRGRVRRYSIWNEPNYFGWLAPMRSAPRLYRALYLAGYGAVKGVDPWAQVLLGETVPYSIPRRAMAPIAFLRGVTCSDRRWRRHCAGLRADGYAHHPYEFAHSPRARYPGRDNATIGTLGRLTGALDRLARHGSLRTPSGHHLDLYLTEFGYFASGRRALPASKRALYLRQAFAIARRNPRVRQLLQYLLVQPPKSLGNFDTGLISRSGALNVVYNALRGATR
jgi:hypothetical protein